MGEPELPPVAPGAVIAEVELEPLGAVQSPLATHLRYRVVR